MTDTKELRRQAEYFEGCEIMVAADDLRALLDEVEALRKDAGRYRFIKRENADWPCKVLAVNVNIGHDWIQADGNLDHDIDALMAMAPVASPQPEKEEG